MPHDPATPNPDIAVPAKGEVTSFVSGGQRYIVMPASDYEGLTETEHLLGSPENAAGIAEAKRWAEETFGRDRQVAGPEETAKPTGYTEFAGAARALALCIAGEGSPGSWFGAPFAGPQESTCDYGRLVCMTTGLTQVLLSGTPVSIGSPALTAHQAIELARRLAQESSRRTTYSASSNPGSMSGALRRKHPRDNKKP
ncbi:hypothetical protein LMG27952_06721 [Paraburkholderia hiiakae]|uniref:Uncharacterized protein n=1 Tax=Paraburkholderia hiiakae TaxID=1081782 RepID=A0ABM8P860_9BURK|nr:hypothetical protein [Paraburkholderia hiiakae]CAD6558822.1 hypothetical protein LMG27952_06721 [Paraburkholderia hiiakae]